MFPRPWPGGWGSVQPFPICQALLAGACHLPGHPLVQLARLLSHQGHLRLPKGDAGPSMSVGGTTVHGQSYQAAEPKVDHDERRANHAYRRLYVVAAIQCQTLHEGSLSKWQSILRWQVPAERVVPGD